MGKRDAKVTAYIDRAAPFARPILKRLRAHINAASPKLVEGIKWGMPAFLYEGKIVCGIAGFKGHCAFWFWGGKQIVGAKPAGAMGNFGRLTSVDDLPPAAAIKRFVKLSMKRIDEKRAK